MNSYTGINIYTEVNPYSEVTTLRLPGNGTILRPGSNYQAIQVTFLPELQQTTRNNHNMLPCKSDQHIPLPQHSQAIGDACYGDAGGSVWKFANFRYSHFKGLSSAMLPLPRPGELCSGKRPPTNTCTGWRCSQGSCPGNCPPVKPVMAKEPTKVHVLLCVQWL